jgi:hypothetical protein
MDLKWIAIDIVDLTRETIEGRGGEGGGDGVVWVRS